MDGHRVPISVSRCSMNQHFNNVQGDLRDLKEDFQVLLDEVSNLRGQLNEHCDEEHDLESSFLRIKAEAQHVLALGNGNHTNIQEGATQGISVKKPVHHEILSFLQISLHENIRLGEKLRREQELLAQTKEEASTSIVHHEKLTTELMTKLNALQVRKKPLYDDQCITEWRNLRQALDRWTKRSFKARSALDSMTAHYFQAKHSYAVPSEEVLHTLQAKRSYIRSIVAAIIFKEVFQYRFVLSSSIAVEEVLQNVEMGVRASDNNQGWEHWRSATSVALRYSGYDRLEASRQDLCQTIDYLFKEHFSAELQGYNVYEALNQIFVDCAKFKMRLERQEFDYQFRRTELGHPYLTEKMESVNFEDSEGSTVQMSVWPSIYKVSYDQEELLLEPEIVWTQEPTDLDTADKEQKSGVNPKEEDD